MTGGGVGSTVPGITPGGSVTVGGGCVVTTTTGGGGAGGFVLSVFGGTSSGRSTGLMLVRSALGGCTSTESPSVTIACSMVVWYTRLVRSPGRRSRRSFNPHEPERLTAVLDSMWNSLGPDDVTAWFQEPWRDGRNAVRLCVTMGRVGGGMGREAEAAADWLTDAADRERADLGAAGYELADEHRYAMSRSARANDVFLEAGAAILGNWIANSDGGGYVPNTFLAGAFWPRLRDGLSEDLAETEVGAARARDCGLSWVGHDERERTFRWLWLNRRYTLAMLVTR